MSAARVLTMPQREKLRACAVVRVSSERRQALEGFSLEAQSDLVRDIAESEGVTLDEKHILIDGGFEGDDWQRPAINEAARLISERIVDMVIFPKVDRFARDVEGGARMCRRMREAGGAIHFGDIGRFTDEGSFRLNFDLRLAIAAHEKREIKSRSRAVIKTMIRQGITPTGGKAPYGYRYVGKRRRDDGTIERCHLVVCEEHARVVRNIYSWYDSGMSLRAIVRQLDADGIAPPRSNWNPATLSDMLKDTCYIGEWYYNKRAKVAPKPDRIRNPEKIRHRQRTSSKLRDKSEWLGVKIDAIVDRELFARVSAKVKEHKNTLGGCPSDRYLLKGLVWCGRCKERCSGWLDRGTVRYICATRDRKTGASLCRGKSLRGDIAESLVMEAVLSTLDNRAELEKAIARYRKENESRPGERKRLIARRAELLLVEKRAREKQLKAGVEMDAFYDEAIRKAIEQRHAIERELLTIQPFTDAALARAVQSLNAAKLRRAAKLLTRAEQQTFLQQWIMKVTHKGDEIEILLRIPVPGETGAASTDPENCQRQQHDVNSFIPLKLKRRVA